MRFLQLFTLVFFSAGALLFAPTASANWEPFCGGGPQNQLKKKIRPGQTTAFRCESTRNATCSSGRRAVVNQVAADTCNAPPQVRPYNGCKLGAGRSQSNWSPRTDVEGNRDKCVHRSVDRRYKPVRCPAGFSQNVRRGRDDCIKNGNSRSPASCPNGTTRRTTAGRDRCIIERQPSWRNVR